MRQHPIMLLIISSHATEASNKTEYFTMPQNKFYFETYYLENTCYKHKGHSIYVQD
jgi:hypothetical protein